jgi:hypothetical protein
MVAALATLAVPALLPRRCTSSTVRSEVEHTKAGMCVVTLSAKSF